MLSVHGATKYFVQKLLGRIAAAKYVKPTLSAAVARSR